MEQTISQSFFIKEEIQDEENNSNLISTEENENELFEAIKNFLDEDSEIHNLSFETKLQISKNFLVKLNNISNNLENENLTFDNFQLIRKFLFTFNEKTKKKFKNENLSLITNIFINFCQYDLSPFKIFNQLNMDILTEYVRLKKINEIFIYIQDDYNDVLIIDDSAFCCINRLNICSDKNNVRISNLPNLIDLSIFSFEENFTDISISNCANIKNLHILNYISCLSLSNLPSLEKIDFLKNENENVYFHLCYARYLSNVCLFKNLEIEDCSNIKFIFGFYKMQKSESLENINIKLTRSNFIPIINQRISKYTTFTINESSIDFISISNEEMINKIREITYTEIQITNELICNLVDDLTLEFIELFIYSKTFNLEQTLQLEKFFDRIDKKYNKKLASSIKYVFNDFIRKNISNGEEQTSYKFKLYHETIFWYNLKFIDRKDKFLFDIQDPMTIYLFQLKDKIVKELIKEFNFYFEEFRDKIYFFEMESLFSRSYRENCITPGQKTFEFDDDIKKLDYNKLDKIKNNVEINLISTNNLSMIVGPFLSLELIKFFAIRYKKIFLTKTCYLFFSIDENDNDFIKNHCDIDPTDNFVELKNDTVRCILVWKKEFPDFGNINIFSRLFSIFGNLDFFNSSEKISLKIVNFTGDKINIYNCNIDTLTLVESNLDIFEIDESFSKNFINSLVISRCHIKKLDIKYCRSFTFIHNTIGNFSFDNNISKLILKGYNQKKLIVRNNFSLKHLEIENSFLSELELKYNFFNHTIDFLSIKNCCNLKLDKYKNVNFKYMYDQKEDDFLVIKQITKRRRLQ